MNSGRNGIGVTFGALHCMAQKLKKLESRHLKSFKMWCWRRMEKIKWSENVTNEQVLESMGEKRALLNNSIRIKSNWIGRILRRNCLLHDVIEGQMTEVK